MQLNNDFNNNPENNIPSDTEMESATTPPETSVPEEATPVKQRSSSKKKKKKMKGWLKVTIWIISIVAASVIASALIIVGTSEFLGIGPGRGVNCVVEISQGMSTSQIAYQLKESGAIGNEFAFRVYSKLKGNDGKYLYGVYTFNNEIGYSDLAEMLMTQGAKAETKTVVIPEGTGINDYVKNINGEKVTVPGIATLLERAGVCSKQDFINALENTEYNYSVLAATQPEKTYYTLEGYLFPETYNFYSYDSKECAALAVERMLKETETRITDAMRTRAAEMGYTMNEILTMASIIQMESGGNTTEAANVAAVFYNRLKSPDFATLGSSPTCYYGDSFKYDDGRYDTYKVKGLPPGPLCSPGIAAINAALYPSENVPHYYFVTDSSGNFYYHMTLSEQQQTINRLKRENKWIYEYFN